MTYDVRVETFSSQPLAVVRRRAHAQELAHVVPEACGVVWAVIRELDMKNAGRNVAVYIDDQINLEVGVEVNAPFSAHGEVFASATPAGVVATTVHLGPYGRLPDAHTAIRQWCADHNYTLAGPNWEIYDHWQDDWNNDPAKIRTAVFYLLKATG